MDAVIGNMRSTLGNGVRKMFSNSTIGTKNNANQSDKAPSDLQAIKMPTLCSLCEVEDSTVPFIVKDICKFISERCIKLEGIFRVSAPVRQVTELRALYESNANFKDDLLLNQEDLTEITGHAAAGLLKQFFRQLPEPLIHNDVLRIFTECKALSDKDFCDKVSLCMDNWPIPHRRTTLFLLSFLHAVAQESENRMSVNGLGVVFGPNVFKLPDGIEGLQAQAIANQAFERLLSCSHILCKAENNSPPTKKQSPPRPPLPVSRRPLPPVPGDVRSPSVTPQTPRNKVGGDSPDQENASPSTTSTKPVPAARKFKEAKNSAVTQEDVASNVRGEVIYEQISENGDDLPEDIKAVIVDAKPSDASDHLKQPTHIPRHKDMPQTESITELYSTVSRINKKPRLQEIPPTITKNETQAYAMTSQSDSEEIPENIVVERENSAENWQAGSGNKTGELQPSNESCNLLDSSIRAIVRTRLFNSLGSASSISDDADVPYRNGLLPSVTAGRDRGPKNRRLPTRQKALLNQVQLDISDDDDVVIMTPTKRSPRNVKPVDRSKTGIETKATTHSSRNSSSVPLTSTFSPSTSSFPSVSTASVTTVTTPDSGCIVDDYPRNSSPIKTELARLDIGPNLSPVHIPKLNLQNSMDEDEMAKLGDTTPSHFLDVPQLDLSSVTESVDREIIKPVLQPIVDAEQAIKTPPRPGARPSSASKQGARKKKRKQAGHKKNLKTLEVAPRVSDSETLDTDCDETMEQTRDRISQNLRDNRIIVGRPYDITKMKLDELKEEKLSMQRELLKYEARHGRPTTKESKQVMREIYDRYRAIKRLLVASEKREVDENENTIPQELNDSFLVTKPIPSDNQSCDESVVTQEGVLDTPPSDLLKSLQELRSRRRRLRRILRDFENERKSEGSGLQRRVMRTEYDEYRSIKSKVRELEVALEKKGVEIF